MKSFSSEYVEKIYAGWLGKIIGIRYGAPVECWTYNEIRNFYGTLEDYLGDMSRFAADDDSNGPMFLIRALEDSGRGKQVTAQDVAEALLNYAPYEHGFFWWSGYGVSTEHTAYLNLRRGIPAPRSGSILQNGPVLAQQIGGQIFSDTWGLVAPGDPALAAELAGRAASVTHDGSGIHGGRFVAACISAAFVQQEVQRILEAGLQVLPADCEYAKVVRAVAGFYQDFPEDWRKCYDFVAANYGYDRYPGACHILPNAAVMVLSLLYGNGDFSRTISICNMCGWDTDCNVGNVGTIMGVLCGLEGIHQNWRKPIRDLYIASSVMGSMNIWDIPGCALYLGKLAAQLAGIPLPEPWEGLAKEGTLCHFEFPGSTHGLQARIHRETEDLQISHRCCLINSCETAATGKRSLKVMLSGFYPAEELLVWQKTYYTPKDFQDSRYDPSFSPLVYPGQQVRGSVFLPAYGCRIRACLYAHDSRKNRYMYGSGSWLPPASWQQLTMEIPCMEDALIDEIGFCFAADNTGGPQELCVFVDDLYSLGYPEYSLTMQAENTENWGGNHQEVSQFTRMKGMLYLDDGKLHLSGSDEAEAYTGRHDWKDYCVTANITPVCGDGCGMLFRVQGAMRAYGLMLLPSGRAALMKNHGGWRCLEEANLPWQPGGDYILEASVKGGLIRCRINGALLFEHQDQEPLAHGAVGLRTWQGGHLTCTGLRVAKYQEAAQ